ncbi:MAG TPA: ribonuclease HII [Bacillota bacterium]|nr:ribonuclease HII [Bacillota bacterium]
MQDHTIAQLKEMLTANLLTDEHIQQLTHDPRKGVQQLVRIYKRNQKQIALLNKQFSQMLTYEKKFWDQGLSYVAGVDEAGRGPLAGPVVAAAVILPDDFKLLGINDSKALSVEEREKFFQQITKEAISYHISFVDQATIDELNILEATKLAMEDALLNLQPQPQVALIDAVKLQLSSFKADTIIKGDEKSVTIAAASILAKVSRDRYMAKIHEKYPNYNFHKHKGYGTNDHLKRLKRYGVSPIHRRSFTPVRRYI